MNAPRGTHRLICPPRDMPKIEVPLYYERVPSHRLFVLQSGSLLLLLPEDMLE